MVASHPARFVDRKDDVRALRKRLSGLIVQTPLIEASLLARTLGAQSVHLKCEQFQRTGSFKFRNALGQITSLDGDTLRRGVVTASSGNHARAVAEAAGIVGTRCVVCVPEDAPVSKIAPLHETAAEIVTFPRSPWTARQATVASLVARHGFTEVPAFDHDLAVLATSTIALEILECDLSPDIVVVPCGAGSLAAGVSWVLPCYLPGATVWAVEPLGAASLTASLRSGTRVSIASPKSVADGLCAPSVGEITWPFLRDSGIRAVRVTEEEIGAAVNYAAEELKLLLEPSAAVVIAALHKNKALLRGKRVACVITGANIHPRDITWQAVV